MAAKEKREARAKKLVEDIATQSDTLDALMEDRDWEELHDQAEELEEYAKALVKVSAGLIRIERDEAATVREDVEDEE